MSEEATLDEFVQEKSSEENPEGQGGWSRHPLSKISLWTDAGGTPRTSNNDYWDGDIPWVQTGELTKRHIRRTQKQITELGLEESAAKRFPPGTLLIGMYGEPTVGESALLEIEATTNQACCGVFPDTDIVNAEFLHQMMQYEKPRLYSLRAGSGQQNIRQGIIRKFEIEVPPLSEQRKIATVLYKIDRAIEKTEEIIEQSRKVKKGLVQDILTKGAKEHSEFETYRLGPIDLTKPKDWKLKPFAEFSYRVQDGPHITPDYVDGGIPFVSSQNVSPFRNSFDYSQYEKYISEETYEEINQNCRPEKGDLIISRRATIGPTQLIRHGEQFGFFVGVAIIKTDDTVHNPFLEQLMNWSVMEKLWHLKSPGSTMKTLNLGTIKEQKIPLPSIEEQKAIAEILRSQDEEIANNERYRESLQRLKQGLMQDLLSGKVRTTDTNIEVPEEVAQHG